MQALHGDPILLAETCVDRSRFAGRCDRAAHGQALGDTKGCARLPGGPPRWQHHGQPKEFDVFDFGGKAAELLRGSDAQ